MNLVLVDGPYGLGKYDGDEIRTPESIELYRGVLNRARDVADHVIVFGFFDSLSWIHENCRPSGLELRRDVVWHKPDATAGGVSTFAPRHEMFLHYARPAAKFNVDEIRVPYGERAKSGVKMKGGREVGWQPNPLGARCGDVVSIVSDRLSTKVAGRTQSNKHPCVKPKKLLELIVKATTHEGAKVYEPFVGSGNLLEVCQSLNRQYFGFDNALDFTKRR